MVDTAGRIPEEFIQTLLSRLDIVEVIGAQVPLRKAGTNYVACCPFHAEKTPSFSVNQQKQFYHCFGCGVSGDAIQFVMEHNALNFIEALETLAASLGMQLPVTEKAANAPDYNLIYTVLSEATNYYEQQLRQHKLAKQAVQYLQNRGLTGVTAKAFRLGFAPPGWDNLFQAVAKTPEKKSDGVKAGLFVNREDRKFYDRFRNRIMFPIRDRRGRVIGFGGRVIDNDNKEAKYLNSPETVLFNKSQELYGLYEAKQAIQKQDAVLVVEGYMDVVSLAQAGITNVVATLGTACTEQHIHILFKAATEIVFCFDGDTAGKKAAWRALELCLPLLDETHRIKFLILGNNEDPDSFVRKHGADAFALEVKKAQSLPDFLFDSIAKKYDLSHIDGRLQLANSLKAYLVKFQEGILKNMLFDRLAQLIDVDPTMLRAKTPVASNQARPHNYKKINSIALVSPATRALALLLDNRDLLEQLPDLNGLATLDIPGSALFCTIALLLKKQPNINDDQIKAQLRPELLRNFMPSELRAVAQITPKEGLANEFLGAIDLLRRRERELALEALLLKAKQDALSAEDKVLLQQMLQENWIK